MSEMITNLAEITNATLGWIAGGAAVGAAVVASLLASYQSFCRRENRAKQTLDELQASYSDNLGRDELVDLYNKARSIDDPNFLRERYGELKWFKKKVKAQLQPIIRDEIAASLPTAEFPEDSLEELSQTYRETYARYRR